MDIRMTPGGSMEAVGDDGNWQRVPKAAADEIRRCHARLEIDHHFQMGENGDPVRVDVPLNRRSRQIDGIECRDATIAEIQRG